MSFHGGFLGRPGGAVALRARRAASAGSTSPISWHPSCRLALPPAASAISSTANCGDASTEPALGDGVSAGRSRCRGIRRSFINSLSRACCCSPCCGSTRGAGGRSARRRACSSSATGCALRGRVCTRAGQLPRVLWPLGLTMGQWLSLPMIVIGAAMLRHAYRRAGQGRADATRPDEVTKTDPWSPGLNRGGETRRRSTWRPRWKSPPAAALGAKSRPRLNRSASKASAITSLRIPGRRNSIPASTLRPLSKSPRSSGCSPCMAATRICAKRGSLVAQQVESGKGGQPEPCIHGHAGPSRDARRSRRDR